MKILAKLKEEFPGTTIEFFVDHLRADEGGLVLSINGDYSGIQTWEQVLFDDADNIDSHLDEWEYLVKSINKHLSLRRS